jgi:hypothetical protein
MKKSYASTWPCFHTKLFLCSALSLFFCQTAVRGQDAREVDRSKILSGQRVYYNHSQPSELRTINAEWIREAADTRSPDSVRQSDLVCNISFR